MGSPAGTHNPLLAKRNSEAEKLNRRRRSASEMSVKVAEEISSFFDRLALLNAGALTFSVTLLGHSNQSHGSLLVLYAAWVSLLIALASCLARNYANMGHRFYSMASNRAESEIAVLDADSAVVTALNIQYEDSPEPFDTERELRINKENREVWRQEYERTKKQADIRWKAHQVAEWTATIGMSLGFLFLIVFAILNTWSSTAGRNPEQPSPAPHFQLL